MKTYWYIPHSYGSCYLPEAPEPCKLHCAPYKHKSGKLEASVYNGVDNDTFQVFRTAEDAWSVAIDEAVDQAKKALQRLSRLSRLHKKWKEQQGE